MSMKAANASPAELGLWVGTCVGWLLGRGRKVLWTTATAGELQR
jgi:hypothetical protein